MDMKFKICIRIPAAVWKQGASLSRPGGLCPRLGIVEAVKAECSVGDVRCGGGRRKEG